METKYLKKFLKSDDDYLILSLLKDQESYSYYLCLESGVAVTECDFSHWNQLLRWSLSISKQAIQSFYYLKLSF